MKLGIIGSMAEEVTGLVEKIEAGTHTEEAIAGITFHAGRIAGLPCVIAQSGICKTNAAICTQLMVTAFGCTAVINSGIAGSLNPEIDIGDVVLSTCAIHHDADCTAFGYRPGEIPRMGRVEFAADERLAAAAQKAAELCGIACRRGRVLSGDQFISDSAKKHWLRETFAGDCVEMEGASVAQTATLNGVPFLVIRSISDKADDAAAAMDYDKFEKLAIARSVALTGTLCALLAKEN